MNSKTLKDIRIRWERRLIPLCVLPQANGSVLVILKAGEGFNCHRYMTIGDHWDCSVDGQDVPLASVFKWLECPKALPREE